MISDIKNGVHPVFFKPFFMNIKVGLEGHETKIVEQKDTAKSFGSGLANVYATPAMIALMENTAYKSIQAFLPNGLSSVGMQVNVSHKKASLPGAIITCKSTVTKIDGKKVFFEIEAFDEEGLIGTAEHIRFVIDSAKFEEKLKGMA